MTSIKLIVTGADVKAEVDGPLTEGMVGIPVSMKYDSGWDGLTKTLVCRSSNMSNSVLDKVRTIVNVGSAATVAHEVMIADRRLFLGVEGCSSDGTLVIPTVWADCGEIRHGAIAGADPAVEATPSVWAQIIGQMGSLDGLDTEDKDSLVTAINEVLIKCDGLADSESGKDGRGIVSVVRSAGNGAAGTVDTYTITYTDGTKSTFTVRNGANGSNGEDGTDGQDGTDGKSAYEYAKEGGYTGTETEFAAKLAKEIPDAYTLPVATSETLGGVKPVAATKEMTQSVGVDEDGLLKTAPGIGSSGWTKLAEITTEEDDVTQINITTDVDGNPFAVNEIFFDMMVMGSASNTAADWLKLYFFDGDIPASVFEHDTCHFVGNVLSVSGTQYASGFGVYLGGRYFGINNTGSSDESLQNAGSMQFTKVRFDAVSGDEKIRGISIHGYSSARYIGVGSTFEIWGR